MQLIMKRLVQKKIEALNIVLNELPCNGEGSSLVSNCDFLHCQTASLYNILFTHCSFSPLSCWCVRSSHGL